MTVPHHLVTHQEKNLGLAPKCWKTGVTCADFETFWGFLVLPALICQTLPDNKCLAGWKIFERSCYYFSTETMSWSDAKETCIDQDAHLVIVESELEQVSQTLSSEKLPFFQLAQCPNPLFLAEFLLWQTGDLQNLLFFFLA